MPRSGDRQKCLHPGCGKSFARKEHLARHVRSHKQTNRYTCQFCQREFTRSDSLQRHLLRHGDSPRPSSSGRSKHACIPCHTSKIKCDGIKPCSACLKKDVKECSYGLQEHTDTRDGPSPSHQVLAVDDPPAVGDSNIEVDNSPTPRPNINQRASPSLDLPNLSGAIHLPTSAAVHVDRDNPIDWMAMRIVRDSPSATTRPLTGETSQNNSIPLYKDFYPLPEAVSQKYLNSYYAHFHHRWTIIHSPSLEAKAHASLVLSSMKMIGAWISGAQDAKWLAIALHERLMAHVIPQLIQISASDTVNDPAVITLCQASLLSILFALYCGTEAIVSRAVLLRNILVSALRETGFFNPEVTFDDPKIFLPVRILKHEERQRLAAYLFKVDAYLSIIRSQPPVLVVEDLHYVLPSTYALHTSHGLDIFDTRYSIEPVSRSHTTMCNLIQVISQTPETLENPTDGLMLVEDIQLGICSLQSRLWHRSMKSHMPDFSTAIEMSHIKSRLENWRILLNRIDISAPDTSNFVPGQHWAMRSYYGMEDHSKSGWQNMVYDRQKSLVYDGIALYHLSNLHLYSNVRILSQLSKELMRSTPLADGGDVYQQAAHRRNTYVKEWAKSSNSRRTLCHAAAILGSYNEMPNHLKQSLDPITYVAISVSALVVWAYASFAIHNCEVCTPEMHNHASPGELSTVELTRWSNINAQPALEKEKEDWIQAGQTIISLGGILLCHCTLRSILTVYQGCLPKDWGVANTIAPGIFKSEDTELEV